MVWPGAATYSSVFDPAVAHAIDGIDGFEAGVHLLELAAHALDMRGDGGVITWPGRRTRELTIQNSVSVRSTFASRQ